MTKEATVAVVLGLVVLAGIVIVGLGAFDTTTMTSTSGGPVSFPEPDDDPASGVVANLRTSPGTTILGIELTSDRHYVHIAFAAPPACIVEDENGAQAVARSDGCMGLAAYGLVSGHGITIEGVSYVFVEVRVTQACFEALSTGDAWPADDEDCAAQAVASPVA